MLAFWLDASHLVRNDISAVPTRIIGRAPKQLADGVIIPAEKEMFETIYACTGNNKVNEIGAHFIAHDLGTLGTKTELV